MNVEQIRELANIMRENGLSTIEVDECGGHIRLECAANAPAALPVMPTMAPMAIAPAAPAAPVVSDEPEAPAHDDRGVDFNNVIEVKSPLVGVYYGSPSPEAEPYVKPGDHVKKGDVLCIIEAMKLMNEITATQDGEIVDICVQNGTVVEFGQTLFKLY